MRLQSIVVLGLGWWLASCEVCGIREEPTLQINFNRANNAPLSFKKITVVSSRKELNLSNYPQNLPLNLNANSTTYVFEQATRTDTLTVFYEKVIENKRTKCGYVLDLQEPKSGLRLKTTFKNPFISYIPYYSLHGREGGIYVSVSL